MQPCCMMATPGAVASGRRLLSIAKFDCTVMLVTVADMVLKPASSNYVILSIFATWC